MSLETLVLLQQALPLPLEQESLPARLLLTLALELLESLPKMAPDIWALSSPKHKACGGSALQCPRARSCPKTSLSCRCFPRGEVKVELVLELCTARVTGGAFGD